MFVPNDPLLRGAAVEPAADQHGAGVGHPAAGRLVDHRRRARHRHGLPERDADRDAARVHATRRRPYPALGPRDDPVLGRAAAGRGRRRPLRRAARFHLGRRPAARLRRPRHARQRHDRPADQRRRRHGRRGVQRQADAGQGASPATGTVMFGCAPRSAAPTTTWRAASGTRPTTARRSST